MANTDISVAAAIAACNAIVDRLDLGSGTASGLLRIYAGTKPAGPDEAPGSPPLCELTLSIPAFGDAVDANPNGRAQANTITADANAELSGQASWFRAVDRNGAGVIDGDVSITGAAGDMQLNSVNISAGAQVAISSWLFTVPEGVP